MFLFFLVLITPCASLPCDAILCSNRQVFFLYWSRKRRDARSESKVAIYFCTKFGRQISVIICCNDPEERSSLLKVVHVWGGGGSFYFLFLILFSLHIFIFCSYFYAKRHFWEIDNCTVWASCKWELCWVQIFRDMSSWLYSLSFM